MLGLKLNHVSKRGYWQPRLALIYRYPLITEPAIMVLHVKVKSLQYEAPVDFLYGDQYQNEYKSNHMT